MAATGRGRRSAPWSTSFAAPVALLPYFVEQKAEEDLAGRLDQVMERLDRIEAGLRPGEDQHALEHLHRGTVELGGAVIGSQGIQQQTRARGTSVGLAVA